MLGRKGKKKKYIYIYIYIYIYTHTHTHTHNFLTLNIYLENYFKKGNPTWIKTNKNKTKKTNLRGLATSAFSTAIIGKITLKLFTKYI